jgi:hypothetical protein
VTYVCDAETPGLVLQLLPEDYYTWADAGWGNRELITIEMCESDYIKYTGNGAEYKITNSDKFKADIMRSYQTAVLLCADICKRYGWNPEAKLSKGMYLISSHNEGRIAGLSSAHVDPDHVWGKFGLTMAKFRKDVKAAMNGGGIAPVKEPDWYRVRLSWADAKSQKGAYEIKENAIKECPPGYSVFDSKGNKIYTNEAKPAPTPSANGYRVRVGIFSLRKNIDAIKKNIKKKTDLDCFEERKADGVHVYCGSFDTTAKANERKQALIKAGFKAELEAR